MIPKLRSSFRALSAFAVAQAGLICIQPATSANAAVSLTNRSFEINTGAPTLSLPEFNIGIYNPNGWTNLVIEPSVPYHVGAAQWGTWESGGFTPSQYDGAWYLRISGDNGNESLSSRLAQNLGTMTPGETYTLTGDAFGFSDLTNRTFGVVVEFVNQVAANPATVYASKTVSGVNKLEYRQDAFSLSYTATAADAGNPLVVLIRSETGTANPSANRGGVDDLRLTTVPEPSTALLGGVAAAGLSLIRRRRRA